LTYPAAKFPKGRRLTSIKANLIQETNLYYDVHVWPPSPHRSPPPASKAIGEERWRRWDSLGTLKEVGKEKARAESLINPSILTYTGPV
jgi:hypothetical protein